MNQENNLIRELTVPPQHMEAHLIDAKETFMFGSRASGKTSIGASLYNLRRVFEMPRSTGIGVGISFNNLYENTVPPFKSFLLENGFIEDVHFTLLKPPPASWPKPYIPVVDRTYKNTMCWYNGTVKQFISLRRIASANGVSAQWGDFDEVKFLPQKRLVDSILPIFRGNGKYFEHCHGYLSKFFMTDKEADPAQIQWLLDKREQVDEEKIKVVLSLALSLEKIKTEYNLTPKYKRPELKAAIHAIETRLAILRANLVNVVEINIEDVRPILGEAFYKDKKQNTPKHEYRVIYDNKDPDRPKNPFYPGWGEHIEYEVKGGVESKSDVDPDLPLIIALDYQHSIVPVVIAQLASLNGVENESLNFIDELHCKPPDGIRTAIKMFCDKYSNHPNNTIYYVFDHTAVADRLEAEPFYKIVIDELENRGMNVIEVYTGQAPEHFQKYVDTLEWMNEQEEDQIRIRISKPCKKLSLSIKSAAAYTIMGKTKKDKRNETKDMIDQATTTHFSDAFDMITDAVIKRRLITNIYSSSKIELR